MKTLKLRIRDKHADQLKPPKRFGQFRMELCE